MADERAAAGATAAAGVVRPAHTRRARRARVGPRR